MRVAIIVAASAVLTACAQQPLPAGTDQQILDRIADECGLPRTVFDLREHREVYIKTPFDAKYESIDCALKEIKKSGVPFKMGFIGNEAYIGNGQ